MANEIAAGLRIPAALADDVIGAVIYIMGEALCKGETVTLRGLGTFKVKSYGPKKVHDFGAGCTTMMKAQKRVHYTCSGTLRNQLNCTYDVDELAPRNKY